MPSPFPGMDPYLESRNLWKGVHDSLVYRMLEDLQPQLQPRYLAVLPAKIPPSDYRICIHRIARPSSFEVIRFGIRNPFPRVGIPLRPTDADVVLDLPAVFQRVYDTGAYHRLAHYAGPAEPPLAD